MLIMPNSFDRKGVSAILHEQTYRTNARLIPLRMDWHGPKEETMERRGTAGEEFFLEFVGMLASCNISYSTPVTPGKPARAGGPNRLYTEAEARLIFANNTPHAGGRTTHSLQICT